MKVLILAVTIFILGLLLFYTKGVVDFHIWNWIYYWWDKCVVFLAWWAIYNAMPYPECRVIKPLVIFSGIRFGWEIVSYFTGITVNNTWAVAGLFIIGLGITTYLIWLELSQQLKYKKSLDK